ncbi:hypothetical protein ACJRO7_032371 [Eucalyptus globulus]|uniref:Thaumatin-like protein n=1 Tax=Eucalyptus globulus TaxID=34317 RepID=A0ABD3JJM6_EUCGL
MARSRAICISSVLLLSLFLTCANAATFNIRNNCPYTVWAAVSWSLNVSPGTKRARIWARTNCQFDGAGKGNANPLASPQNTLAEYALNQFGGKDFFDISLVDGFNVSTDFSSTSNGCTRGIKCTADINGQCPTQLKAPGGCNNPCTVFKTDQYCCNSGSCGPTNFSKFFKDRCPDAYSYPKDDQTSTFTCPGGTNYRVVFCP